MTRELGVPDTGRSKAIYGCDTVRDCRLAAGRNLSKEERQRCPQRVTCVTTEPIQLKELRCTGTLHMQQTKPGFIKTTGKMMGTKDVTDICTSYGTDSCYHRIFYDW